MKKTLAIFLSLALVICMIPATASVAFADPEPAIQKIDLSTVSGIEPTVNPTSGTYNGKEQKPTLSLKVNEVTLEQGKDFNVTWSAEGKSGAVDAAKYTAKVTAIDSSEKCLGEMTIADLFEIKKLKIDEANDFKVVIDEQPEGADALTSNSVHYIYDGEDMTTVFKDQLMATKNIGSNTAKIVANAGGNLEGTIESVPFDTKLNIATYYEVAFSSNDIKYTGSDLTSYVQLKLKSGAGSPSKPITTNDYKIICSDAINANAPTGVTVTVEGKGNYAGFITGNLVINSRDGSKSNSNISVSQISNQVQGDYHINPVIKDSLTGKTLEPGKDFTVLTSTIKVSGTEGSVDIVFLGNYTGTRTETFKVIPSGNQIKASHVTVNSGVAFKPYYAGYTQKPTVIVNVLGYGSGLVEGRDYTVSYIYTDAKGKEHSTPSPVDAYRYKVKVTGIGNYAGEVVVDNMFEIQKHPFSKSYLNITVAQGNTTQLPSVTVRSIDNRITFKAGTDYTVGTPVINSYTGKATVTISSTGTGNLASGTITETYAVNGKNIAYCSVEFATGSKQSYQYTGSVIKPQVKVRDGYTTLTEGTDYTVTYKDAAGKVVYSPKDAGTYTIVIEGKGLYSGTTTMTFYIVGTDISGYTVTLKESSVNATGYAQTPVITSVKKGVYSILTSNDYTVTYQDATGKTVTSMSAPGTYKVVVTGKNGYSGSTYATFRIVGLPQTVTVNQDSYKVYTTSDSFKITAKATGDGTGFTYTSSNPAVASVSAAGYVTIHKVGRAVITVTTTGNKKYEPTSKDVTVKVYPSKAKISKKPWTDGKKAQMKVRWGYQDGVTKYQIRYSRDKNFKSGSYLTKTVKAHGKSYTTQSTTISNLKSGYTYYFKVRAVYTDPYTGDTYYGSWSPWRSAKTK